MNRLLLGVGNRLSRDDGVGPIVATKLASSDSTEWTAIDCGTALENASGIVSRENPDLLVIVDAAQMGLPPGSIRSLPTQATDRMLASTHGLPLTFVLDRLRGSVSDVLLVGIEPEDLSLGEGLSSIVGQAADRLVELLAQGAVDGITPLEN